MMMTLFDMMMMMMILMMLKMLILFVKALLVNGYSLAIVLRILIVLFEGYCFSLYVMIEMMIS